MDRFKSIEDKIRKFAEKYSALVYSEGSTFYQIPAYKIQERRIIWIDGNIGKAVFIIPHLGSSNFDFPSWDFSILAWLKDDQPHPEGMPFWEKSLLQNVPFAEIEKSIDELLLQSVTNLASVTLKDLKLDIE